MAFQRQSGDPFDHLADINVTPLVDVMLVLLIIFMVTAPMMQQGFTVNLPQSTRSQAIDTAPLTVTVPADVATRGRVMLGEKSEEVRLQLLALRLVHGAEQGTAAGPGALEASIARARRIGPPYCRGEPRPSMASLRGIDQPRRISRGWSWSPPWRATRR